MTKNEECQKSGFARRNNARGVVAEVASLRGELSQIDHRIEALRDRAGSPGALHYGDEIRQPIYYRDRLASFAAELDKLERRRAALMDRIDALTDELMVAADGLDYKHRSVIRYRAVYGCTIRECAALIGVSSRHVYRLYNEALQMIAGL